MNTVLPCTPEFLREPFRELKAIFSPPIHIFMSQGSSYKDPIRTRVPPGPQKRKVPSVSSLGKVTRMIVASYNISANNQMWKAFHNWREAGVSCHQRSHLYCDGVQSHTSAKIYPTQQWHCGMQDKWSDTEEQVCAIFSIQTSAGWDNHFWEQCSAGGLCPLSALQQWGNGWGMFVFQISGNRHRGPDHFFLWLFLWEKSISQLCGLVAVS